MEPAEEAVRLAPDSLPASYTPALARLSQEGSSAAPGSPGLLHLRRAVKLGPDYAPTHTQLARVLLGREAELDDALALALRTTTLEPSNADHRTVLARVLERAGRFEEARAEADRALLLSPQPVRPERGA